MKQTRYEVLDGLRGTAAFAVVLLHLFGVFRSTAETNPLHHAYLAVDFFYMLSGYVIGHAYDARWTRMTVRSFFAQRLRRLHPLVLLGVALGLHAFLIERVWLGGDGAGTLLLSANVLLGALLLPAPSLPGRPGETHSLDGPCWSLGQEYLANIAYALFGRKLGLRALTGLVAVSAVALVAVAASQRTLNVGWNWETLWCGPVRTAFPFFMGLLLQRRGVRLKTPLGFFGLSLVLLAAFAAPTLPGAANGLFEVAMVIGVFPLIIAAGAGAEVKGALAKTCNFVGELSYPIYIIHFPVLRLFGAWVWADLAPRHTQYAVGVAVLVLLPIFAWAALRTFDEPIRARLSSAAKRRAALAAA